MLPCLQLRCSAFPPRRTAHKRTNNINNLSQRQSTNLITLAASSDNNPAPQKVVEYKDTATDIAMINMCRVAYANISGWQSEKGWKDGVETYQGMIEVSKSLMRGRTAAQQREAVIRGFPQIPPLFRKVFPYSKWGAEINAKITPAFFTWLVGPMKTVEVEFERPNGEIVVQNSGVQIEKCRYLAESGCVGMCVNLCKAPVQTFFTNELGMPLTMEPNFEDMSCKMIFGQAPLPLEEDPVYTQACLKECSTAKLISGAARCHKLD